ncbi:O-acetylhomoserine sulfhydrylase [Pontibacillus halophilus JSM 076056 = DSM 19796]|uniref:O-acetylhomoserine sulfhydrylase n=1 Tax=Pontibacillus halophilus JSM 076056 = DSM 19796 TaxID=1385510 RepID=A0A0A5GJ81_9BACI|nr:O-acetylhomoserine aminocarboxypropyltransferase/cysteine synthase family protein [Pontibacillus halophilus]KGX91283.1 O-acetylhomoserine sulfhydrylase [Pontibacillus halophilus JSM 076056 = DSM 19796]
MSLPFHTYKPDTLSLHGGQQPDPTTGSRAVPIYQTTSYVFRDTEHAQNLFALAEPGNIYSRIGNPTVDAFEQRIALLEDGVAAVATSSGMAAITLAILNVAEAGDEIVASTHLYGGTYNLLANTLPRYGINVTFVDGEEPARFKDAITSKTKAIFAETIGNPSLHVLDIEAVADIAHEAEIPLIVDNTFATPLGCQPLNWGADVVVHSATKWIGGHGTTIAGVVVDGGRFNWNNKKFPGFTEPDQSYHGIRYGVDVGSAAFATKLRVQLLRDIGAALSPHSAFLLLQGIETLPLRLTRHTENAQWIAEQLNEHPGVDWVSYPGLENHPAHELGKKYLSNGFGSIVVFGIRGGREEGRKVIDSINLFSHLANVGDAKSLIIHPASTTHQQLNEEDLRKTGVREEMIRLSIGLEDREDLLQDLTDAIEKATDTTKPPAKSPNDLTDLHVLASSLYRDESTVRPKSIAVVGARHVSDPIVLTSLTKLARLGFHVKFLDDAPDEFEHFETISSLNEEDIIYILAEEDEAFTRIQEARQSIILSNRKLVSNPTFHVYEEIDAYEVAIQLRTTGTITDVVTT